MSRSGHFIGLNRPSNAGPRQARERPRGTKPCDPPSAESLHRYGTSASTRNGLPLPRWIFSGGQISTLPMGGS
jgi:hypothetical protein